MAQFNTSFPNHSPSTMVEFKERIATSRLKVDMTQAKKLFDEKKIEIIQNDNSATLIKATSASALEALQGIISGDGSSKGNTELTDLLSRGETTIFQLNSRGDLVAYGAIKGEVKGLIYQEESKTGRTTAEESSQH